MDFITFIHNDEVASWAFWSFKTLENGKPIAIALVNGTCLAICDGSYQSKLGIAVWVIVDESESGYVWGSTCWKILPTFLEVLEEPRTDQEKFQS